MDPWRRRVVWSQGALRDLDSRISYIAEDSPDNAERVLERMLGAAASLEELSDRGRVVPESTDPSIRELLVGSFRLLYHVGRLEVAILAVLHQRQDLERWRRREDSSREDKP